MEVMPHPEQRSGEDDARGVSEVIDTLLLVAVVVILAAIASVFAFGLSDAVTQDTPQASIGIVDHPDPYEAVVGTGVFTLSHGSGDDLLASETRIVIRNTTNDEFVADLHAGNAFNASSTNVTIDDQTTSFAGETLQTGDVLTVTVDDPGNEVFQSGTKYEILVVDTESDQLVASRTVTLA